MKPEVIELEATWYGGRFHFNLAKNLSTINKNQLEKFWHNINEIGVWDWHKKYPYWKQKHEPLLDGCNWKLKIRDKKGNSKYCFGYESFPRNFKRLIYELNVLFNDNVIWR